MASLNEAQNHSRVGIKQRRMSIKIDMTPMVDLAFLLLTFFVLTTRLADPYVVNVVMPDETQESQPINQKRVLTILLGAENKIYWYRGLPDTKAEITDFSENGIRKVLTEQKDQIEKIFVLVKPMESSKYKNVIDILDEFIITDIHQYSIANVSPEDENLLRLLALH